MQEGSPWDACQAAAVAFAPVVADAYAACCRLRQVHRHRLRGVFAGSAAHQELRDPEACREMDQEEHHLGLRAVRWVGCSVRAFHTVVADACPMALVHRGPLSLQQGQVDRADQAKVRPVPAE